jgi:hypothetical protein
VLTDLGAFVMEYFQMDVSQLIVKQDIAQVRTNVHFFSEKNLKILIFLIGFPIVLKKYCFESIA